MQLSYYPGCSLTGTAKEYDDSVRELAEKLGIELVELDDWNCCGASSAHMTNHDLSVELSARNLHIAAQAGLDVLVPCSACFQRLRAADHALAADPEAYNLEKWNPSFEVKHISAFLDDPEVMDNLKEKMTRSLADLPVACYYGCLSQRPPKLTGAKRFEIPESLDRLIATIGGKPVSWTHKTECCSGSLTMARPDIAHSLIGDIVNAARHAGAEALVTDCPMCHANIESRQLDMPNTENAPMPVFFATELLLWALSKDTGVRRWKSHLVDPMPVLGKLEQPATAQE